MNKKMRETRLVLLPLQIILLLLLIGLVITACGGSNEPNEVENNTNTANTNTSEENTTENTTNTTDEVVEENRWRNSPPRSEGGCGWSR